MTNALEICGPDVIERLLDRVEALSGLDLDRGSGRGVLSRYLARHAPGVAAEELLARITSTTTPEAVELLDAVTVCHTSFHRDAEQMDMVASLLARGGHRPFNVWVAACATGEEAYTVALLAQRLGRPVRILGTDLNSAALAVAARRRYSDWALRELPPAYRPFFTRCGDHHWEIDASVAASVTFARHNLIDRPPDGAWDLVLCRNVLMYLSRHRVATVLTRLGKALAPGGKLLLGAGDVLASPPEGLQIVSLGNRFVLERVDAEPAPKASTAPTITAVFPLAAPREVFEAPPSQPALERTPSAPAEASSVPAETSRVSAEASRAPARGPRGNLVSGHERLEAGEVAEALECYARALDEDPLDVEARFAIGIAHHLRDEPLEAVLALRGALVLEPELWPAELYLGLNLRRLGEEGADAALARAARGAARAPGLPLSDHLSSRLEAWRSDVAILARSRSGNFTRRRRR